MLKILGKYIAVLILIAVLSSSFSLYCLAAAPKVALVLGGGAARGFSHIGLIQALEDNGIPIDMLIGTSMGSIVSSLYAAGYSVENMKDIVTQLDTGALIDLLIPPQGGFINTVRLEQYLDIILHHKTFAELNTPFYSVITQLDTGRELALNEGKVSTGVQASMSIPALFPAVLIDEFYYVDGGMKNAVPANVAADSGADVIIGVDVKKELRDIDYDNILNNFQLAMWFMIGGYVELNTTAADVIIVPDVKYDSYMDYQKAELFIREGYAAGLKYMDQIKTAILAQDPNFQFIPYHQPGYDSESLRQVTAAATKAALEAPRPFAVAPQIAQADDNSLQIGVKFAYGPLSWFNMGYLYGFSPTEGGHQIFVGWSRPMREQARLWLRKTEDPVPNNVGLDVEVPLGQDIVLKGTYQWNGPYTWRISLLDPTFISTDRFELGAKVEVIKNNESVGVPFSFNLGGRGKLFFSPEYFSLMEVTLAKPYLYAQIDLRGDFAAWEPQTTYQLGLGTDFRLFGMYPFTMSIGLARTPDAKFGVRFSLLKEVF